MEDREEERLRKLVVVNVESMLLNGREGVFRASGESFSFSGPLASCEGVRRAALSPSVVPKDSDPPMKSTPSVS